MNAKELAEKIFNVGHNNDCIFCGFKDKIAKEIISEFSIKSNPVMEGNMKTNVKKFTGEGLKAESPPSPIKEDGEDELDKWLDKEIFLCGEELKAWPDNKNCLTWIAALTHVKVNRPRKTLNQ